MKFCGREELIADPGYATPEARLPKIPECFSIIEKWTMTKTKFEVMEALNEVDVPCGPILSMKDIYEDKSLYERGYLVELDHPTRGRYVQVGSPINLSELAGRGETLAASGRAHRRDPRLARLRQGRDRRLARGEGGLASKPSPSSPRIG